MKVLHLIARMNVGGTARYLTMLDAGLNKSGIESAIATGFVQGAEAEDSSIASVKLHRINHLGRAINPIADHKAFKEFKALVAKEKPDIIHSHTFKAGLIARARRNSFEKAAGKKIKFVHTFHGHLLDDPEFTGIKKTLIVLIEKKLAAKTDKLVSVGRKVANDLAEINIGTLPEYSNIPPGVEYFQIQSKADSKIKMGLSQEKLVVGWLGRVTGVKNPQLALEIAKDFSDVNFIFGGIGNMLEMLRKDAPPNCYILGWVNLIEFLSACDIFLSTSENEGMPAVLIEAQLAGLPVIATNVGSTAEVVMNNETGILTSKNKSELVAAIRKLLNSPETIENMGNSAKSHARTHFSPDAMINKHIDLYRLLS